MLVMLHEEVSIQGKERNNEMKFKFFKWYIRIEDCKHDDHWCLNQIMEGDYECEVCNPDP